MYCFYEKLWKQTSVKISLNLQVWCKNFVIVNNTGCLAVKLKEYLLIRVYFSNYLQLSLIWSDGNVFADEAKNICFDWSRNCRDFFRREFVKFVLPILTKNISPLKLQTNVSAHAQIYFEANLQAISPNGNPPLVLETGSVYLLTCTYKMIVYCGCSIYSRVLWYFPSNLL